jgi:hypothetical protein
MAKKLKIKLPKRVAGVKIPKAVRKGPVAAFLNSGAGQLILAETLVAAAGALAVSKSDPDVSPGEAVRHPVDTSRRVGRAVAQTGGDQAARLSYALREAARAFRDAIEAGPAAQESGSDATADVEAGPAAKKKHSSRSEPVASH